MQIHVVIFRYASIDADGHMIFPYIFNLHRSVPVSPGEASLSEVAVLILDHYLSQRDIWHLHAAMMQVEMDQHGKQWLCVTHIETALMMFGEDVSYGYVYMIIIIYIVIYIYIVINIYIYI